MSKATQIVPTPTKDTYTAAIDAADALIVVGTSGVVYPAASLPERALDLGKIVIQVNPEPTPLSDMATVYLRTTASAALQGMAQRLPFLLS